MICSPEAEKLPTVVPTSLDNQAKTKQGPSKSSPSAKGIQKEIKRGPKGTKREPKGDAETERKSNGDILLGHG